MDVKKQVDFALPCKSQSVWCHLKTRSLRMLKKRLEGKTLIVTKGNNFTETYFEKDYPNIKLQCDQYSDAYQALLDGRGDTFSTDNTEVLVRL